MKQNMSRIRVVFSGLVVWNVILGVWCAVRFADMRIKVRTDLDLTLWLELLNTSSATSLGIIT